MAVNKENSDEVLKREVERQAIRKNRMEGAPEAARETDTEKVL